jgi:hypothetical protein
VPTIIAIGVARPRAQGGHTTTTRKRRNGQLLLRLDL